MSKHTIPPLQWPAHGESCCTPARAWQWVNAVAEMAVYGDDDAARALPEAVDHYLAALRQIGVAR